VHFGNGVPGCVEYRSGTLAALLHPRCYFTTETNSLLRLLSDRHQRPKADKETARLHLENWIHGIIQATLRKDAEFRGSLPGWYPEAGLHPEPGYHPGRLMRSDVERYQQFKLLRSLKYCYEKSSFYREQFHKAGISPAAIQNREDLSRFPLTDPLHIAEAPYQFLCLSRAEIARIHTFVTSGTTGPQKKIFWTQGDLDRITDFMSAGMGMAANSADVVQIFLPDGRPNSQADLLCQGVKKLGATPVVSEMNLSAQEHLTLIEKFNSTILFGYAGHLFRLSKDLQHTCDLSDKGVKILFLAAEYLPDSRRRELRSIWNCRVRTHYGLTEMGLGVAVECEAGNGYHFNEADLLLEIINPKTGEPVTAGQEGELVFTTLNREAMPLIRYRTHDISRLILEPCACGAASLLKIDKVKKRLESIVALAGGDEVYPALFDDVLYGIPGLIDYQLVIIRREDKDCLNFRIEMQPECADRIPAIHRKLKSMPVIAKNIAAGRMAKPSIEMLMWGALKTADRAKKIILDRR
jgi:phenylacetate-CoA ligase